MFISRYGWPCALYRGQTKLRFNAEATFLHGQVQCEGGHVRAVVSRQTVCLLCNVYVLSKGTTNRQCGSLRGGDTAMGNILAGNLSRSHSHCNLKNALATLASCSHWPILPMRILQVRASRPSSSKKLLTGNLKKSWCECVVDWTPWSWPRKLRGRHAWLDPFSCPWPPCR